MPNPDQPSIGDNPERELDAFAESLGLRLPVRALLQGGPPIDYCRLQSLVRRELNADESHEVCALIATFRSWEEGYQRILMEPHVELSAEGRKA